MSYWNAQRSGRSSRLVSGGGGGNEGSPPCAGGENTPYRRYYVTFVLDKNPVVEVTLACDITLLKRRLNKSGPVPFTCRFLRVLGEGVV